MPIAEDAFDSCNNRMHQPRFLRRPFEFLSPGTQRSRVSCNHVTTGVERTLPRPSQVFAGALVAVADLFASGV